MQQDAWKSIFDAYQIHKHNFAKEPFILTAEQIKKATAHFTSTKQREVRILCKQDTRESRPDIFKENNLFILPIKNGIFAILEGEGYVDIPEITSETFSYNSKLDFELETSKIGNSEMQHLDFAYAASLIRSFLEDDSLILTIRGRKYTREFDFYAGKYRHHIVAKSVQTEVDAGYEGKNQVVLIEAKNSFSHNIIIRQLFFPFRQWQLCTRKKVHVLFFEKRKDVYSMWEFGFEDERNYNSIHLLKSARFKIM